MRDDLVHWMSGRGTICGAPGDVRMTGYQLVVTCPRCQEMMREATLRRREAVRRLSLAAERLESLVRKMS